MRSRLDADHNMKVNAGIMNKIVNAIKARGQSIMKYGALSM